MHIAQLRFILHLLVQSILLSRGVWYLHPMTARCLRCYHTLASWSRSCFDMFILGICLNVRYSADHNETTIEWCFEENNFVLSFSRLVNLRQLLGLPRSYRWWSLLCFRHGASWHDFPEVRGWFGDSGLRMIQIPGTLDTVFSNGFQGGLITRSRVFEYCSWLLLLMCRSVKASLARALAFCNTKGSVPYMSRVLESFLPCDCSE